VGDCGASDGDDEDVDFMERLQARGVLEWEGEEMLNGRPVRVRRWTLRDRGEDLVVTERSMILSETLE
jgi:hypothetical protein